MALGTMLTLLLDIMVDGYRLELKKVVNKCTLMGSIV